MKNAYLNSVIIYRLYPCTIQKKNKKLNKNILLINQRKDEKKIINYF